MPQRTFQLVLTTNSVAYNLYSLMLAAPGAVPTDGILPDRVQSLLIQSDSANKLLPGTPTVRVGDSLVSATVGQELLPGDSQAFGPMTGNSLDLRSYYLWGTADGAIANVTVNSA